MADIAKDAKIKPDEPTLSGISRLLGFLWRETWNHAGRTASGDADALHDMRVALRRLRSCLENFEGEKTTPVVTASLRREFQEYRSELGKIGDALGYVRDHDVLDGYLKTYALERLKIKLGENLHAQTQYSGLLAFERALQDERAKVFAPMVKRINKARRPEGLQENFARWALGLPAAAAPAQTLRETARLLLPIRIAEVLALQNTLDDAADEIGHHDLRKALRRLRYTLETLGPCFNASAEEIKTHLKTLVELQDVLGEMQDRAVLHEKAMECFGDDESTLPPDIAAFLRYGTYRKRRLLGQVRALWRKTLEQEMNPFVLT
jgi:CHAD domain-containing protein